MKFAVFGLGNIGLPLACIFASIGHVIGADIDEKKVQTINSGTSTLPNEEKVPELLKKYIDEKKIEATADLRYAGRSSDVKIIIIPLLIDDNKKPDFSSIISVSEVIGETLKKEDVVIVSTTMPIGATRSVIGKILEAKSGMKMGIDFYLAYAPEQTMNPHVFRDLTESYEQVIGGVNEKSSEKVKAIYEKLNKKGVHTVRNSETAELIKLSGVGLYRYANIALAAEIAKICERLNIDFKEVMEKTNLVKYYNLHEPTIGIGGHCAPVYPHFIANDIKDLSLLNDSIKINESMPKHAVEIVKSFFGPLNDKKIAVLGLSYRGNIKEDRYSPSYEVIRILKEEGAIVFIHDPRYSKEELERKTASTYIDTNYIKNMDGAIVATDHDEYRNVEFDGNIKFVFDGKSFLDHERISGKGIKYLAVGRTCF